MLKLFSVRLSCL